MAKENKLLEMDLSAEDEKLLRESLETWREEVYSNLLSEVEVLKEKTIQELEEANQEYLSEIKKEYTTKMVNALNEMREDIRSEVFNEMVVSNPELQVLEKIKALVAPTLNEEFTGNVYSEQITNLVQENSNLKRELELNEGARTLAGLIKDYDRKTQKLILSVIKEGNAEEITEQFFQIAESLELFEGEDDETGDAKDSLAQKTDKEYEDFTAWKKDNPKPSKDDFDDAEGYKKAVAQWETDADKAKEKFESGDGEKLPDEDEEEKTESYQDAYAEWVILEPSKRDFDLKEDYEYAHSLWEEDEPKEDDFEVDAEEKDDDEEDDGNSKGKEKKAKKKAKKDDEDEEEVEDESEEEEEKNPEDQKKADKKVEESTSTSKKGLKSYIKEGTVGRQEKPKKDSRTMKDEIKRLF